MKEIMKEKGYLLVILIVFVIIILILAIYGNKKETVVVVDRDSQTERNDGEKPVTTIDGGTVRLAEVDTDTVILGAADIDAGLYTFSIPAYSNCSLNLYEVDETAKKGQVDLWIDGLDLELISTTNRTNSSLDEACDVSVKLQNLDIYEDGSFEVVDNVVYADKTYRVINTHTEFDDKVYMVGYTKNSTGEDLVIELIIRNEEIKPDSEIVKKVLESLKIK